MEKRILKDLKDVKFMSLKEWTISTESGALLLERSGFIFGM